MIRFSRRRFLALSGGFVATGCRAGDPLVAPSTGPTSTTAPTSTTVTTIQAPPEVVGGDRVLVMVELAGGNDALNTLPPVADAYRRLRPTLALGEDELLIAPGLDGHALHPSLAPLIAHLDAGRLAVVAGIGFENPDRSHFVSTDRWLRADRMDDSVGWLGRWLDTLPTDLPPLGATALGSGVGGNGAGALCQGHFRGATVIDEAAAFALPPGVSNAAFRTLAEPVSSDPLLAAAQAVYASLVGAVEEFDPIADNARAGQEPGDDLVPAPGSFGTGLAIAAELVAGDVGTRIVTVRVGGFDTHAAQLSTHGALLADLADGLDAFWRRLDEAGAGDRVLLATHSEFGRRVAENGSAGSDHGAAGVSFVMGADVVPGLHGVLDADDLLDGDLRPVVDPRTMFTTCLDWLGADVERILGERHEDAQLLV